jgi:hypothetical protein
MDVLLRLDLEPDDLDALETALLRARASELSEVRRRDVRLTAGYGDATTRDVMDDEGRKAQRRHDALTALLGALRAARSVDAAASAAAPVEEGSTR